MINEFLNRYPQLAECINEIDRAAAAMIRCYKKGGKLLLCGNGGSSADCDHIAGELMKGFLKKRSLSASQRTEMLKNAPLLDDKILDKLQGGLPAISLPSMAAINSAFCNDVDPELIYAQTVFSLAKKEDTLIAISTSGNSKNVLAAAKVAKALNLTVIALTGKSGGTLKTVADICICVPETETFKIQELHLPVYHYLCAVTEDTFFKD